MNGEEREEYEKHYSPDGEHLEFLMENPMPKEITGWENLVDDVIHDLEALDFNSKEARDVVRKAIDSAVEARERGISEAVKEYGSHAGIGDVFYETIDKILSIINPSKE